MKILFVPYGTDEAPATRYRVTQYLRCLKNKGIEYSVFSAISRFSTENMLKSPDFGRAKRLLYYVYIYIERVIRSIYVILVAGKFDIIFLQRTTFPFGLEAALKKINERIVFDIDDAIYLTDKKERGIAEHMKKYIKEREVVKALKSSKFVIVENEYIKNFVSRYCKNISKIPGPIDIDRFFVKDKVKSEEVVIGWIGSPATTAYLYMLNGVFSHLSKKYNFLKFRFIGLGRYKDSGIEFEKAGWRYDTEIEELQNFDIGIMPMPDNMWTRGKLGCKMLQYMAVGRPCVVSYTPTNAEIIVDGVNGFFAKNEEDWIRVLSNLIDDEKLRKSIGINGRETVVEKCGLNRNIDKYLDIFSRMMGQGDV